MCYRLSGFILLCILSIGPAAGTGLYYNDDSTLGNPMARWMRWLPDDVGINALSIPGTHDTMALHDGPAVETQTLNLHRQLRAGIRQLDIRARLEDGQFEIYHGNFYQDANFDDVLTTVQAFLSEYPTETILLHLSDNGVPDGTGNPDTYLPRYMQTFMDYRDAYSPLFWQPPATAKDQLTPLPLLGDVRGKVVLLQDFPGYDSGTFLGINYDWGRITLDNGDKHTIVSGIERHGRWQVAELASINSFWQLNIKPFYEKIDADSADNPDLLYQQTLNGWGLFAYPNAVAGGALGFRGTNDYALEYLFAAEQTHTGITTMDFPGAGLINAVVAHNFSLVDFSDVTAVSALKEDFHRAIFRSLVPSADDDPDTDDKEALDRAKQLRQFFDHVLPGHYWHVVVAKDAVEVRSHCAELCPGEVFYDGYQHYIYATESGSTDVSKARIESFLAAEVSTLRGSIEQRTDQLQSLAQRAFPTRDVSVLIKQGPFGYDNWGFIYWGQGAQILHGNLRHVVMVHSDPVNDVPEVFTGVPNTRRIKNSWSGYEGKPLSIGVFSRDQFGEPMQYRWDFDGDGSWDTDWSTRTVVSHVWQDDFDGRLKVQAFDGEFTVETSAKVTIADVLPNIHAPGDVDTVERLDETFRFSDPGSSADGPYRCIIHYGRSGSEETIEDCLPNTPIPLRYDYQTDTTHTVSLVVVDAKGASTRSSFQVTLQGINFNDNVGCLKQSRWQGTLGEGLPCDVLMYSSSYPLASAIIDYGDGTVRPGGYVQHGQLYQILPAHRYSEVGSYTITVVVTDVSGRSSRASFGVDVVDASVNVPPGLTPTPPAALSVQPGQAINLRYTIDDPDDAQWTVYIRYADGLPVESFRTSDREIALAHTYSEPGDYTLAFSIEDVRPLNSSPRRAHAMFSIDVTVSGSNE